ncbi:Transketolase-like protein 2 [Trichinella zimbabwensis]|uniref:transketolase n=1 Tax=Trichinella zimbabwensis TaxID=268475 RepID=A0A0V1H1Q5_9BILA|nr:Transketolase-like protein 2 [Trichinella zimbabwensis]
MSHKFDSFLTLCIPSEPEKKFFNCKNFAVLHSKTGHKLCSASFSLSLFIAFIGKIGEQVGWHKLKMQFIKFNIEENEKFPRQAPRRQNFTGRYFTHAAVEESKKSESSNQYSGTFEELKNYIQQLSQTVQSDQANISEEEKDILFKNLLNECNGHEISVLREKECFNNLRIIIGNNASVAMELLWKIMQSRKKVILTLMASYGGSLEKLLAVAFNESEEPRKAKILLKLSEIAAENFDLLSVQHGGGHLLRRLGSAISGVEKGSHNSATQIFSTSNKNEPKRVEANFLNQAEFISVYNNLAGRVLNWKSIRKLANREPFSLLVQDFIAFDASFNSTFVNGLLPSILEENKKTIYSMLTNKQASRIWDQYIRFSSIENVLKLYENCLRGSVASLISDQYANYPLQQMIKKADDSFLAQDLCEEVLQCFTDIWKAQLFGVVHSLCIFVRGKQQLETRLLEKIKTRLNCRDPKIFETHFLRCLLSLQCYVEDKPLPKKVKYFGSVLTQTLATFSTKEFFFQQMLNLPNEDFLQISSSNLGSYAIEALVKAAETPDQRRAVVNKILPIMLKLAGGNIGSRVLECVWENCEVEERLPFMDAMSKLHFNSQAGKRLAAKFSLDKYNISCWSTAKMPNALPDLHTVQELKDIANKLRIHSIRATNASNSGHPTSCCSMAEIMSVLFFHTMKYDPKNPRDPHNDRFILSKGHAGPILYACWVEAGLIPENELLNLRKIDSDLEGHPTPRLSFVDVATGSLGQGLSCAAGMAYVMKFLDKIDSRVYCVLGDGESAEGSVWEALHFAGMYELDNLVAIFDINRLGQSQPASLGHRIDVYQQRLEAFGWNVECVDGHDVEALCRSFSSAAGVKHKPTAIVAKTFKGFGIPKVEDQENWHGKALGKEAAAALEAINSRIKNLDRHKLSINLPRIDPSNPLKANNFSSVQLSEPPNYKIGEKVATRLAYGTALVKLGKSCDRVVALDGDVKNSTFADKFKNAFPDRFIECFIAEQNMVWQLAAAREVERCLFVALLLHFLQEHLISFGWAPYLVPMSSAVDRMQACQLSIDCVNIPYRVNTGEDGPSQMGLEDIAMFRTLPGSTVFYPSDAVSCERAVELAARVNGICFIRTGRPNTPVIYANEEQFSIGQAKIVRHSDKDCLMIVSAGVTLFEAFTAADVLAKEKGLHVCICDLFTVKPIDKRTLAEQAKRVGGKVLTVEDHYPEGGIGDAVASALAEYSDIKLTSLAVNALPRSGPPDSLMDMFGISAKHIIEACIQLVA